MRGRSKRNNEAHATRVYLGGVAGRAGRVLRPLRDVSISCMSTGSEQWRRAAEVLACAATFPAGFDALCLFLGNGRVASCQPRKAQKTCT